MRPILYAITDRHLMGDNPAGRACLLMRAGVDWLQVREKDLGDGDLIRFLGALVPCAREVGAQILVNGRPDLALAAGASGVHLPSDGLSTSRVRALLPSPHLVVRSCHNTEEAMRAQGEGADAVTLGPVFPTPSKAGLGEPLGLERFADACGTLEIPVLALGGVFARNVPALIHAGAAGIAAIRLYWEMKLPEVEIPGLLR